MRFWGLAPPEIRSKDRKTPSWFGNLLVGHLAPLERFHNTCFEGLAIEDLQPERQAWKAENAIMAHQPERRQFDPPREPQADLVNPKLRSN